MGVMVGMHNTDIVRHLLCIISIILLISVTSVYATKAGIAQPEKILLVTVTYKDNALSVTDLKTTTGYISTPYIGSERVNLDKADMKVYSTTGDLIYNTSFYISNKKMVDILDEETGELGGGTIELNDVDFVVTIPYSKSMNRIEISSKYGTVAVVGSDLKGGKFNMDSEVVIPKYYKGGSVQKDKKMESLMSQIVNLIDAIFKQTGKK